MSPDQVVAQMGKPDGFERNGDYMVYQYVNRLTSAGVGIAPTTPSSLRMTALFSMRRRGTPKGRAEYGIPSRAANSMTR